MVEMVVNVEGCRLLEVLTLTLDQGVGDIKEGWMIEMASALSTIWIYQPS
jgi:hypothetical protein